MLTQTKNWMLPLLAGGACLLAAACTAEAPKSPSTEEAPESPRVEAPKSPSAEAPKKTPRVVVQDPNRVVPFDLTKFTNTERLPTISAAEDGEVLWELPNGGGEGATFDFAKAGIDLREFDEFRFDIKPVGSQVGLNLILSRFPTDAHTSSWYLKFPAYEGQWSHGRFDLSMDDEGIYYGAPRENEKLGMAQLSLYARFLGFAGEPKWRKAFFRNVKFVKHVVTADFSLPETQIIQNDKEVVYIYTLHITNRTDQEQDVEIDLDGQKTLTHFKVEGPTELTLGPKEQKSVQIRLSISLADIKANELEPLYSEMLIPIVSVPGVEDSDVFPLRGYRRFPMWATVPIFERKTWVPEQVQALLAERGAKDEVIGQKIQFFKDYNMRNRIPWALSQDWPVPTFTIPGFDQTYRCPDCNNQLGYVEPLSFQRHWCNQCKKEIVDVPDMSSVAAWRKSLSAMALRGYHTGRSSNVLDLARMYLMTGNTEYADKAVQILVAYAKAAPDMQTMNQFVGMESTSGFCRIAFNSLHTCYAIQDMFEGFALLRDYPGITDEQRKAITAFIIDEASRLAQHSVEYGNQQAEHLRAYGTAGMATGFWPLVAEAIYGDFGFFRMVQYAFSDDGILREGGAYHFAIYGAMSDFATFMYREDIKKLFTPEFKRVFVGTIETGLDKGTSRFEVPYIVYNDPGLLKNFKDQPRGWDFDTILLGALNPPKPETIPMESKVMDSTGYVYLRTGTAADNAELHINYLINFDRSEQDQLTTFFYRNGRQVDTHVNRISYGVKGDWWMTASAAHNKIIANGRRTGGTGILIGFDDTNKQIPVIAISSDPKAPLNKDVDQLRVVALLGTSNYIVFDRVVTHDAITIDRYQWGQGTAVSSVELKPFETLEDIPRDDEGKYRDIVGGDAGKEVNLEWSNNAMKMRLVTDQPVQLFKATSFGGYEGYPMEVTFVRRPAAKGVINFLATFSVGKDSQPAFAEVVKSTDDEVILRVKTEEEGSFLIKVDVKGKKVSTVKE